MSALKIQFHSSSCVFRPEEIDGGQDEEIRMKRDGKNMAKCFNFS
jgi:hypothetical protein